jgi:hypothetical protein
MRACFLALAALICLTGIGCRGINLSRGSCDCGGHGGHGHGGLAGHGGGGVGHLGHHHQSREYNGPQGPATAQVGYPYYTTRGPRDFLVDNPPSIGR